MARFACDNFSRVNCSVVSKMIEIDDVLLIIYYWKKNITIEPEYILYIYSCGEIFGL